MYDYDLVLWGDVLFDVFVFVSLVPGRYVAPAHTPTAGGGNGRKRWLPPVTEQQDEEDMRHGHAAGARAVQWDRRDALRSQR